MRSLRFTLIAEDSSDEALLPILSWTIREHCSDEIQVQWADLRRLPKPPRDLEDKIEVTLELYPCDLLFVHRDADRAGRDVRAREIEEALTAAEPSAPAVCVIPVRALEAWFLFDEAAIRRAAGNPNGKTPLDLPNPSRVEELNDPKTLLHDLVHVASELTGRRKRRVDPHSAVHRIAGLVRNFTPLRRLSAFRAFEKDLKSCLERLDSLS